MKWLINNIDEDSLLEELLSSYDIPIYKINYKHLLDEQKTIEKFCYDELVMFHGSLNDAKFLNKQTQAMTYAALDRFKCTNYYCHYGDKLLNYPYSFISFKDLKNPTMKNRILSSFGNDGCVFVRPNDGAKSFTGRVIDIRSWEQDINLLCFEYIPNETLCLVSEPINIQTEWRLWIGNGEVIGHSMYKPLKMESCPPEAIEFATECVKLYQPERLFVMDVCKCDNGYKIVEINSFGCSGFYKVDLNSMIPKAMEIAKKEYEDINNVPF